MKRHNTQKKIHILKSRKQKDQHLKLPGNFFANDNFWLIIHFAYFQFSSNLRHNLVSQTNLELDLLLLTTQVV